MTTSEMWVLIWALTLFSTYHVVALLGRSDIRLRRLTYELLAAFGWGGIIVFWMH